MSREKVKKDIDFEMSEIESEIEIFKSLITLCKAKNPDHIETAALGSLLHAFYTGIEKIFLMVAKKIDNDFPEGPAWHKDLLIRMTEENEVRKPLISEKVFEILVEYLNFRHYFRHAYEYRLDWEKMKGMVLSLNDVWNTVRNEIRKFIEKLE